MNTENEQQHIAREQAYRDAALLLKHAAGPNVFLLLCGAPLIPSIGCAQAIRITCSSLQCLNKPLL